MNESSRGNGAEIVFGLFWIVLGAFILVISKGEEYGDVKALEVFAGMVVTIMGIAVVGMGLGVPLYKGDILEKGDES